jgi:hypothetical protein
MPVTSHALGNLSSGHAHTAQLSIPAAKQMKEPIILKTSVDRSYLVHNALNLIFFLINQRLTRLVSPLQAGLHGFAGTWLRCNSLEWNDHSASLRLTLHPQNRTLQPVQLRFLGLC